MVSQLGLVNGIQVGFGNCEIAAKPHKSFSTIDMPPILSQLNAAMSVLQNEGRLLLAD
jgi:hypothetical protein